MKNRLAIISTHPIQYYAPLFKLLTERGNIQLKVFYTWPQAIQGYDDPDFNTKVQWDIPLLEGYAYQLVNNVSHKPSSRSWAGIDTPTLINEVEAYQPDAVLVFGWKLKSHFALMRHFKGKVPVWFRGDSTLLDYDVKNLKSVFAQKQLPTHLSPLRAAKLYLKYKLRQTVLSLVYRYVDKAFYVGTNSKQYFLAHGLKNEQLVYAPHAIDNQRFEGTTFDDYEAKAKAWRSDLGILPDDKVVLYAGKLEPKKNPELLLQAVQVINSSSNTPVKLIIIGSGALEEQLKAKARMDDSIYFLPFVNQSLMPVAYRLGDVFCLPSQGPEETWGLAVNESLASGRLVLVSDKVGCAADVVNDSVGRIFESGNMQDLKSKLLELIHTPLQPSVCQQHISAWSFEHIAEAIEKELKGRK